MTRTATIEKFERPIATKSSQRYETATIIGGVEAITAIEAEWIALCEQGASNEPFFRPEWFRAFVANFDEELKIVTVRRDGKLVAILPLATRRENMHGMPVRKLAAVFNLQSQRFDLVRTADETDRSEIIHALWREIISIKGWDVFETRLTYRDSWIADLAEIARAAGFKAGEWIMDEAPYVTLPEGDDKQKLIDDYFKGLTKNRRKLLSKNLRHLEEIGAVEFKVTRGYEPSLMKKYFELEAQSWKARAGTDVNSDPRISALHEDFARECARRDAIAFHELKLGERTIAMYLSLEFDARRTIGWKMSFDEEFARFSPGNVLFREVLNECMRRGSLELDMLSPSNYNKRLFASGTREHSAFYIFRPTIRGRAAHFWKFRIASRLRDMWRNEAAANKEK